MQTRTMTEMKAHVLARATEDADFRASLLANPKSAVSAELGVEIPDGFTIIVHEDDSTTAHLSLPATDQLTPEELAQIGGGVRVYNI